jgi:hypothetical protein
MNFSVWQVLVWWEPCAISAKLSYATPESALLHMLAHVRWSMQHASSVSVWCGIMEVVCSVAFLVTCGCVKMTSLSIKHPVSSSTPRPSIAFHVTGQGCIRVCGARFAFAMNT